MMFSWTHTDKAYAPFAFSWCIARSPDTGTDGGNFVDVSTRTVIEQAEGTLFAFNPEELHGTTELNGRHHAFATISFSSRLEDAFKKLALQKGETTIDIMELSRIHDLVVLLHDQACDMQMSQAHPDRIWAVLKPTLQQLFDLLFEAYGHEKAEVLYKEYIEALERVIE